MRTTNIILLSFLVTAISFCFIQYSDAQEQVIDKDGYHKITGTKFDEYGFDKDGFDYGGYHKTTDTKFDEYGYDKDGFTRYGWSLDGINKYTLTKFDKYGFDKYGFDKDGLDKSGLLAKSFGMEFKMIPFKGEERFAKLISSGMVDFYDNDSPAYILNVKLNDCPNELKEKLILVIRNSHTIKPSIFPTGKSIGAYWQSDRIEESIAQSLLRRTIINFTNKVNEI